MAAWIPVTVVPTSLATVAIDTFMTEVSSVIRNCAEASVSSIVPPAAAACPVLPWLTPASPLSSIRPPPSPAGNHGAPGYGVHHPPGVRHGGGMGIGRDQRWSVAMDKPGLGQDLRATPAHRAAGLAASASEAGRHFDAWTMPGATSSSPLKNLATAGRSRKVTFSAIVRLRLSAIFAMDSASISLAGCDRAA